VESNEEVRRWIRDLRSNDCFAMRVGREAKRTHTEREICRFGRTGDRNSGRNGRDTRHEAAIGRRGLGRGRRAARMRGRRRKRHDCRTQARSVQKQKRRQQYRESDIGSGFHTPRIHAWHVNHQNHRRSKQKEVSLTIQPRLCGLCQETHITGAKPNTAPAAKECEQSASSGGTKVLRFLVWIAGIVVGSMGKRLYVLTRDLHLYAGLFLSPFVLVFTVSVFFLVHAPREKQAASGPTRVASDLDIPNAIEQLSGREQVVSLRRVLEQIGVEGEVNFVRRLPKEHRLIVPVLLPGRETVVDLDVFRRTATISDNSTGLSDAVVHLHKMPGPHNVNIRGNSVHIRVWRWLADITTYGLLFLTVSGLYLWAVIRAERNIGVVLMCAGGISFFGLVYAITR